ncbi:zinc finger CCCH domain-containing protein 67-like [Impatiens glandulifera]|uniref:zinc finger CCCH domain-containing protein 67-like n=1 Tax=Impatiens glandulifera TaxID=253017 RepID=UPI001FB16865|nr:zinc finger CCCH domain-containing protein 67-like [Impatiens glandulifera]
MGTSDEKNSIVQLQNEPTLLQPEAELGFQASASLDSDLNPNPTSHDLLDELPTVVETHNQQCDDGILNKSADEELQYQRLIIEGIQNLVLEERERESKEDADHEEYIEVAEEDDYKIDADRGDNGFEESYSDDNQIEEDVYTDEGDGIESSELEVSKHVKYNRPTCPVSRLDAEDCPHFMRTGTCKFGSFCKFNHPPNKINQASKGRRNDGNSERMGQVDCKYYLVPGGCKYGNTCKFKHRGGNNLFPPHNHCGGEVPFSPVIQFNFLGLPINVEEKDCPYYMRTGTCKYGANCRFNHPDPSAQSGDPHSGYNAEGSVSQGIFPRPNVSSWSTPNEAGPRPTMFPPRQLNSVGPQWNSFQAPNVYPTAGTSSLPIPPALALINSMSETNNFHMYHNQQKIVAQAPNVYPTAGTSSLPIPPALALINSMPETNNFHMYHNQQKTVANEYPDRPGQPECSFFMKTGSCKYKSTCKFHHPRLQLPKITNAAHSGKGLPLRPDRPICTDYGRYGICKDGRACEYDHPANYSQSISSSSSSSSMPGPENQFGNWTVNNNMANGNPGGYFTKPQIQQSF